MRWLLIIIGCFTFSESFEDFDNDIHEKYKILESRMYMLERRNEVLELKIENMQRDFDDRTVNLRNHIAEVEKDNQELAKKCLELERRNGEFELKLNEMQTNSNNRKEMLTKSKMTKPERKTFQTFEVHNNYRYNKGIENGTAYTTSVTDDEASGTKIGNADSEKKHSMGTIISQLESNEIFQSSDLSR
jgi:predicted RNase H-like nuclease (RuvC/YqgF family)